MRIFTQTCEILRCGECSAEIYRELATEDTETWVRRQRAFIKKHPPASTCRTCGGVGRVAHMPRKVGTAPAPAIGWNRCHECLAEGSTACQACGYFGVHWNVIGEPFRTHTGTLHWTTLMGCPRCGTVRMEERL